MSSITFLGLIFERGQVYKDAEKTKAVTELPTLQDWKQLQRFLGFVYFYRRFIRNYSQVTTSLTQLTFTLPKFIWIPEAEAAFCELKQLFSSAPILSHPDSRIQFMVKVDASDTGVGAVLSQKSPDDGKLHPCAFFSRHLSPAERNYDVGNRELLAIKLTLEWGHWLE